MLPQRSSCSSGLLLGRQFWGIVWKEQSVTTVVMKDVETYSLTAACIVSTESLETCDWACLVDGRLLPQV